MFLLMFIFFNNPIFCCAVLIFYFFLRGFRVILIIGVTWFFYIFGLIFLGGIIVMLVFFCSILPNEKFSIIQIYSFFYFLLVPLLRCFYFADNVLVNRKIYYSLFGVAYFMIFYIFIFFLFFSFYTYSNGFSMRRYFCFFSLNKI